MGFGISDLEMIQIATLTLGKKFKYTIEKRKNGIEKEFFMNTSKANFCFKWKPMWNFEKAFSIESRN